MSTETSIEDLPPIRFGKVGLMLACLLRDGEAFVTVRDALSADAFTMIDRHLATLWELIVAYHRKFGSLPPLQILQAELDQAIVEGNRSIGEHARREAFHLLEWAFSPGWFDADVYRHWAVHVAREVADAPTSVRTHRRPAATRTR